MSGTGQGKQEVSCGSTTRDITDEWNVVTAIGCFQDVCAQATAPGNYNDPDMLVVGKLGKAWMREGS